MPEPRETHAAIDARRNAQRGGGEREALARLLAREFGAFLAHDPDKPDVFWGGAADVILAAGWVSAQRLAEATANAHSVAWQDKQNIICACGQVFTHDYGKSPAHILGTTSDYYLREHCGDRYARHLRDVRAAPSDPATDTRGEEAM